MCTLAVQESEGTPLLRDWSGNFHAEKVKVGGLSQSNAIYNTLK